MVLLTIIFFIVITFLFGSIFSYWVQIFENLKQKEHLVSEYSELLDQEQKLNSEVTRLQDPEYVARYARENYLYSKVGEKIIRIVE